MVRLPNASLDGSVVIAQEIERRALRFPAVATVVTKTGRAEEQSVELDRAALARCALYMAEVNELLETGVAGRVVSTFIEGQQRFPITVRLEEGARNRVQSLGELLAIVVPMVLLLIALLLYAALGSVRNSALVSFIGHLPMLYATGSGADIQKPLAVVVMGGLVTSTLLTLIVVPVAYYWLETRRSGGAARG